MEFSAAAAKRLSQYAFLPSKKQKKYAEVHELYLKAAHSHLKQALSSSPSSSSALFALSAESFSSAADVASRKLRAPSSALSAYVEAALSYQRAEERGLAYDALRKAMEQRDACVQRRSPVPPSASPVSARPEPAGAHRLKNRRSSDAGPIRDTKRASKSMPASPLLASSTPPLAAVTAPGSPRDVPTRPGTGGGVLSRMKKLMVRTDKDKAGAAGKEAKGGGAGAGGGGTAPPTDVSPLPPLHLPIPGVPSSPDPQRRSTSPMPPRPAQPGAHLAVPGAPSAASGAAPASPRDGGRVRLSVGRVPTELARLLDPRLSLQLSSVASSLAYSLWDDAQFKAALESLEISLSLLAVLDDPALHSLPPSTLHHARSSRLVLSSHTASLYLAYHAAEMDGKPSYECDLRLLQRARDLFVHTARMHGEGAATRRDAGEDAQATETEDEVGNGCVKQPPLPSCLSAAAPSLHSALFSACLCDAVIMAYTGGFGARVLSTPPLLSNALRLCPAFLDTVECKFLRQTYGLLQLSSSAPARLLDHSTLQPGSASTPEEHYRRLLLGMWGNEIVNEFVLLLTRFLYHKRGLPQPPPPLSPTTVAKERGEEGKLHPLLLMGGLCKDETEDLAQDGQGGVDGLGMQLLLKCKRLIRQNVAQPGFRYVP